MYFDTLVRIKTIEDDRRPVMKYLDNYLTSGHEFSENESLKKFQFMLLNTFFILAISVSTANLIISLFGIINFGLIFEILILAFNTAILLGIYFLRKSKAHYRTIVFLFLLSVTFLYYIVLLKRPEDEFRLIAFFMAIYMSYVFLGKGHGLFWSIFIMVSIPVINANYFLNISSIAYSTFYSFFIGFSVFFYLSFHKVESDSSEFELLNSKLKEKAKQEAVRRIEQEEMLLRQGRMANMGEMLDSIAHQWRQPLMHINSILMNIDSSFDADIRKNQGKDYLENKIDEVATLTAYMSQTIEDFRGLFKVEKEKTYFAVESAVSDVLSLMKNRFNNIKIDYVAMNETSIFAHRSELIQVIIIVLSNAVEVLNSRDVEDKRITIDIQAVTDNVVITIEDSAGGIIPKNIEAIFTPYFTTKEQSGGTGLGLYLAKIIVEQKMNGSIDVSNTSSGAKFSIVI